MTENYSKFATSKSRKNEFYNLHYALYDVEHSAEGKYCIVLKYFKSYTI